MNKLTMIMAAGMCLSLSALAGNQTARKAEITCDFKKMLSADGNVILSEGGELRYVVDLDSKNVTVHCLNPELCLLDGTSVVQTQTTPANLDSSFRPISETSRSGIQTIHSNLPAINVEGSNGDDMDMFTRLTFELKKVGSEWKTSAIAVLIYADTGNDGQVSSPTTCSVKALD